MAFLLSCIMKNSLKSNLLARAFVRQPCPVTCLRHSVTPPAQFRNIYLKMSLQRPALLQKSCAGRSRCALFHSSAPLRAGPAPLIWLVLRPLQKIMAVILGRSIRKWWAALPDNRRQLLREWMWLRRWRLAAAAGVTLVIMTVLLLTHLDQCPLTGRTRLLVFSRENYMELAAVISQGYMEEFEQAMVPVSDPHHQVVELVMKHLVQRNKDIPEVCNVDWTVHVVQDPKVNAFVLPNGKVFVFTGMLEAVTDVHQLTVVLGHEMAHALLSHAAEQASLSHVLGLLSMILLTVIWAVCPRDSVALLGHWAEEKLTQLMFQRPYSRKLEAEADEVGLQLAAKACADVRAGPVFWQQMDMRDQLKGELVLPEWLSTHPSHKNRYTQMDRSMPQALELRESCVCPPLPDTDPRIVFSKSVRALLGNQAEAKSEHKLPLPAAAVMALTPQPLSLTADKDSKTPLVTSEMDRADHKVQCVS